MRYTPERKKAVLKKMMPPHARPVSQLAIEEGISEATLYKWRQEAHQKGILLPNASSEPNGWSAGINFQPSWKPRQ
jgi:transposase-like protein